MKKIEPGGPAWNKRLAVLAEAFVNVVVCSRCNSPAAEGYECIFCDEDQL